MYKQILAGICGLCLASGSYASNADVQIRGGQAGPGKAITLKMDKLAAGVTYDLSCYARSDRYSGKGKDDIQVVTIGGNAAKVYVNGNDTSKNLGNVQLTAPLNSFIGHDITNDVIILIYNHDRFDTIFVERCVATPKT